MRPGDGRELVGMLGIDAALDRVPAKCDVLLPERQLLPRGHQDLRLHDVDAGDHLGHRMLDLYPRVHLDEIELALLVQELEGARAAVADLAAGLGAALADADALLHRDQRRGRLLDDLLVAALHRAIAVAQIDRIAVFVGEHLDLDVARGFEKLLHVHRRVAESGLRLLPGHRDRVDQRGLGMHHAHAASAAAAGGLDDDRIADLARDLDDFLRLLGQRAFAAGHDRHAGL